MQLLDDEFELVLFDLDGTLADTAPDMVAALRAVQQEHEIEPTAYELARSYVSHGAIGLLSIGFPDIPVTFGDDLHLEYLEHYSNNLCNDTVVFDGLGQLLADLDDATCPWGVVTNKPEQLTIPLIAALGLADRIACTVSGDTLPVRKPDPAPILLACDLAGVDPHKTIYVGDADRDIEAGREAGTATIAAAYGYITEDDDPREWDADIIATDTDELAQIVLKAVNLEA